MAFERLRAAILMLAEEWEAKPEDDHELHLQLQEKLAEIRAMGMPLPDDLVELEKKLERDVEGVTEG
ncbi:MAG: hypothetical protein OXR84_04895 [Magnetovibrio sp.]|nr:hypothetical protein [Magnetovibrio sp.]